MITEAEARKIASEWHGGQWSPLYAFSSTGTIVSGINSEIEECLRTVYPHSDEDISNLRDLRAYIHSRQED